MLNGKKIVVVMPAYNAARTLERTWAAIPRDVVDLCLLVDDGSRDETVTLARRLGIRTMVHTENRGYGDNLKTGFTEALRAGADIVVVLHPDFQYDPTRIPALCAPLAAGEAAMVLGSRTLVPGNAKQGGMPLYKRLGNAFLAALQNAVYGTRITDWATGYKAISREALESIRYCLNSDDFLFDEEINTQLVLFGFRIGQVPIPTRYFDEASSVGFAVSVRYGIGILWVLAQYFLHRLGVITFLKFKPVKRVDFGDGPPRPFTP